METTWIGQEKLITFQGRLFANNDQAADAVVQLEWAYSALKRQNETFPNGKQLHEIANETIEKYEDALIGHQRFTA